MGIRWFLAVLIAGSSCAGPATYAPLTREITVTTVPLLVREARGLYPFLAADFATGGLLEGKEVYLQRQARARVELNDILNRRR